jgi:hypothetical protein
MKDPANQFDSSQQPSLDLANIHKSSNVVYGYA